MSLFLLTDDYPVHNLSESDYVRLMSSPPYWAFCWGGGQALARWILDHPYRVQGRRVVDFGAGSGVAGIASLMAGALEVTAVDIDEDALIVCMANSEINGVRMSTSTCLPAHHHYIMLAADVCYEGEGAALVAEHLAHNGELLVSESRMRDLGERFPDLVKVAQYHYRTFPDLDESDRFNQVDIYHSRKG